MISPKDAESFELTRRSIDGRVVTLGYTLRGRGGGSRIDLEETLQIPESLGPLGAADDAAVACALLALHVVGGTSYWKTAVPRRLVVRDGALTREDAAFWTEVYTKGLGEFFYRNGIDPNGAAVFEGTAAADPAPVAAASGPVLLLWGGGKDSVVSQRVLAQAREPHELLTIGRSGWEWISRSAAIAGVPHHVAERRLDPKLFDLNAKGALNGHVPVNAYLAAAGVLIALLTGRRAVVASNESSASVGSTHWKGLDVNHQWSKSLEFERGFRAWLSRSLAGGPEYFSLLRPLTELRIVKGFVGETRFFSSVTSCNRNFSQSGPAATRWCLTCPKCVFVSLMARPWLDDAGYHTLFGGDALADPANCETIEELLGLRGVKPFECVGTPDESAAAVHLARARGITLPHGCMTVFGDRVAAERSDLDVVAAEALRRSDDHAIPPRFLSQLDAYLDRH